MVGGVGTTGAGKNGKKAGQGKRCDPNHKTLETAGGKKVELHSGGIIMDSGNGMRVVLDDADGIFITSPSKVTIKSEALIEITSLDGKVEFIGSEGIEFCQNVSSREEYMRRALAGSISGVLSGATTLALADAGLLATMGSGFAEGFAGEAVTQKLLNEDGSIDWGKCFVSGIFTAAMDGGLYGLLSKEKTCYDYLDEQLGRLKDKVSINKYESSECVNDWWASKGYENPPYTPKTVVQDIKLSEDTVFVRVYDNDTSGLVGGWVMRPEDIKGLTPLQIQEKFALPATPKYIGEVKIEAGNNLRMGEVNPNFGFGGGGIQFDLKGQYIGEFEEIGDLRDWSFGNE